MQTLDVIARVIGYGAMLYGLMWLAARTSNERAASRAKQADRDWLESLKVGDPSRYEREIWWRNNKERYDMGLPTDPGFEEQVKQKAKSMMRALDEVENRL